MRKTVGFKINLLLLGLAMLSCGNLLFGKKAKSPKEGKTAILSKANDKARTFFSSIDPDILRDVEIGSPATLKSAIAASRKSEVDYTDAERVLIATAQTILKVVYPMDGGFDQKEILNAPSNNPYLGALASVELGIFDTSTGNGDFLATVLPAVVVLKKSDVSNIYNDCKIALDAALVMRGNSALAHYLMATLYLKAKKADDAVYEFKAAAGLAPESAEILYSYVDCLVGLGRTKEASSLVSGLLEKDPTSRPALKLAALVAFTLGNNVGADEYITRVLQQEPNDLEALLFRAKILYAKKDYIKVASLLDLYARQDPKNKDYLLLRCSLQYDWSHAVNSAIATLETAITLYGDDTQVLLMAARLGNETGSKISGLTASEYARKVLDRDPSNPLALQYSIDSLIVQGEFSAAYTASKGIIARLDKDSDEGIKALLRHVTICLKVNKGSEAMAIIEPLYRARGGDENVTASYITALSDTGEKAAALSLINKLLGTAQSKMKSFLYYRRSLLAMDNNQSVNDLRSALMSNPRNSDALFRLYQIYYGSQDFRKAQYYLKQVVALNPNNEEYQRLSAELTRALEQ